MASTTIPAVNRAANREKHAAALLSLLLTIFMTLVKITIGVVTISLGIITEAVHSLLDLVAHAVSYAAIHYSGRPADEDHTYGHGKIENLSALFETLLLLATCAWIVYESILRLVYKTATVDPSIWAYIIMAMSIVVNISLSRVLYRVARKYNSDALEADALNFKNDIWSSAVVIVGLLGVWLSHLKPGLAWLAHADSLAALGVAGFVVNASTVSPSQSVVEAHERTKKVEDVIVALIPNADVTIHVEPKE